MSTLSKIAKIIGLASSMVCQANGIPFSVESSMILEELLSMVGNSNSLLQDISAKIDSIITSDFYVAEEHLKTALSASWLPQRQTALFSAKDLFMKSYYRMREQPIGFLSAESAVYCGLIDFSLGDIPNAIVWFDRGADEFMSIRNSLEKPEHFVAKMTNDRVLGPVIGIVVFSSLFSPVGWGLWGVATLFGAEQLSKRMPNYKELLAEFETKKVEALEARIEVLKLKAEIAKKFAA